MMEELWDDYLQYLIWRGGLEKRREYSYLFETLHNIEFTYIIDRDDNRDEDGHDLRNDYKIPLDFSLEEDEAFYAHWTSVFEVLLAIAIRVDNEYIGDPAEEHPEEFFMEMIKNLGLDRFTNRICQRHCRGSDIERIVNRWLDRKFDRYGGGSPFPVRYDHRDQRKLEIWDQMNSYISENYE